jgi:hypothetical protein
LAHNEAGDLSGPVLQLPFLQQILLVCVFLFFVQEKIYAARKPVMPLASKQDRLEVHQAHLISHHFAKNIEFGLFQ